MPQKSPKSLCGGGVWWVGKPNLVKCFGPRLRIWTWTLDFVPGPSFSILSYVSVTVAFNILSGELSRYVGTLEDWK